MLNLRYSPKRWALPGCVIHRYSPKGGPSLDVVSPLFSQGWALPGCVSPIILPKVGPPWVCLSVILSKVGPPWSISRIYDRFYQKCDSFEHKTVIKGPF